VTGCDDGYGIGLGESGEIEEIGVLVEVEIGVVAPGDLNGGRDDCDPVVAEEFDETTTTLRESV
jgi:hypothetical protein